MENLSRRGFLGTMLKAGASAAIIMTPGLLMPIKPALVRAPYDPAEYEAFLRKRADEMMALRQSRMANPPLAAHIDARPMWERHFSMAFQPVESLPTDLDVLRGKRFA